MNSFCLNGIQKTPEGETGVIVECQVGETKGNHCRFCRWCGKTKSYVLSTDSRGIPCRNFEPGDLANVL